MCACVSYFHFLLFVAMLRTLPFLKFLEEKEVASKSALKSEQFLYCASWGRLVDVEACFSGLEWG